jgi:hypothetical protein
MLEFREASQSRWLWIATVAGTTAVCTISGVGLALAMVGRFNPLVVLLAGIIAAAVAMFALAELAPRRGSRDRWAVVALLVVLLSAGWHAQHTGEHVVVDRDPGSYQTTARWLVRDGGLRVYAPTAVLEAVPGVRYEAAAVYDVDSGVLEFQFNHGAAVVLGVGYWLGGAGGLFAVPVVVGALGLLALYLCIRPFVRNGALAVAAIAAIAVSLPFINVVRDTYSEAFVFAMVWTAMAALLQLWQKRSEQGIAHFAVGALFGAASLVRVDALLYVAAGCLLAAVLRFSNLTRRGWMWMALGASGPVALGAVDTRIFAGAYSTHLRSQIALLALFTIGCAIGAFVLDSLARRRAAPLIEHGLPLQAARILAAATSALFAAAWLIWPQVRESTGNWSANSNVGRLVTSLQEGDGDPIEATRSYAEHTVTSLGWYFGAAVLLFAAVGIFVVVFGALRSPRSAAMVLSVAGAIGAPLYLVLPNIAPDQLWMTRRYAPFVVPCLLLMAAIGADRSLGLLHRVSGVPRPARAVGAFGAVALLSFPALVTTWPIRNIAPYRGHLANIEAVCDQIGERATVLLVDDSATSMPLRAWCGADVGIIDMDDVVDALPVLQHSASSSCSPAYLVSRSELPADVVPSLTNYWGQSTVSTTNIEWTLDRPPKRYRHVVSTFYVGAVLLEPQCAPPALPAP